MTVVFIKSNSSLIISTFGIFLMLVISFKIEAQTSTSTAIDPCGLSLGRIADLNDTTCQVYFYCFYNGFNISFWKMKCPNKLVFRPYTRTCVSNKTYPCYQTTTPPSCLTPATSASTVSLSPTTAPTTQPSVATSPSANSTSTVASSPTTAPTTQPSVAPSPTTVPTTQPSVAPSPTTVPTTQPSVAPSPTTVPTTQPSVAPSPTTVPTTQPSANTESTLSSNTIS